MQAGLLGHEEQPPELTLRNLHRERRKRGKRWSQVLQLSNVRTDNVARDDRSAKPKASVNQNTMSSLELVACKTTSPSDTGRF